MAGVAALLPLARFVCAGFCENSCSNAWKHARTDSLTCRGGKESNDGRMRLPSESMDKSSKGKATSSGHLSAICSLAALGPEGGFSLARASCHPSIVCRFLSAPEPC
eukprot:1349328-Lingulodinium_polyedra.AAC.1